MWKALRGLAGLFVLCALLACPKSASASPPGDPALKLVLHSGGVTGPDTLVATFQCTGAAPNTFCGVAPTATGGTLTTGAGGSANSFADVAVGASGTLAIVCGAPNTTASVTLALFGKAPGLPNSPNTATATASGACPPKAANLPGVPVIAPFVLHSGG